MGMQWYTPSKSLGNLSKGVFERRTSTGSEVFFILKHLDASKFVFLSVFIIIETICPKIWAKLPSKNEEDRFRLTCVTQKRLCLSSLLSLWRKLCGKTLTRPPELTWAIQRFPHFLSRLGKPLTWEQIVASARRMTRLSEFGCWKDGKLKLIITCGHAFPPMRCELHICAPSFDWFVRLHGCTCPKWLVSYFKKRSIVSLVCYFFRYSTETQIVIP